MKKTVESEIIEREPIAKIIGHDPIAKKTSELYYVDHAFIMVKNGVAEYVTNSKAQKFLEKNAPEIQMYKLHSQLLHR